MKVIVHIKDEVTKQKLLDLEARIKEALDIEYVIAISIPGNIDIHVLETR